MVSHGDLNRRRPGAVPRRPLSGFSHLVVEVTDLERAVRFYREVLALDVLGCDLVNEGAPNVLLGMNTRHRVLLVKVDRVEPFRKNSSSIHHAWFLTPEQFERAASRMREAGHDIDDSRAQFRPLGERSMDLFDPDGHRYQVQVHAPEARTIQIEHVGRIACGRVADYRVGDVRPFIKGKFFIVRLKDGFLALSRWCTHKNGLLTYRREHWHFYCPMHGVTYTRDGTPTAYCREVAPLRRHPLTIEQDGTLIAEPDVVIERTSVTSEDITPCAAS